MKNKTDIDEELLQELIGHCEDHMSSPFKDKAKAKAAVIELEPEEGSDEEEATESSDEESKEDKSMDDMDPEQLQKLLDLYKNLKG